MRADCFGFEQDLNAIRLKQFVNFGGNVRVFTTQDLLSVVRDRDGTTKAAKHLAEFQANVMRKCSLAPYRIRASVTENQPRSSVHVRSRSKPASRRRASIVAFVNL